MRHGSQIAAIVPVTVFLFAIRTAVAQMTPGEGLPTLGPARVPRPEFGYRPTGEGFRPQFGPARPGLLRQSGLQDAMQSARNSPLERALRQPPPAVQFGAELGQALEAMRQRQEAGRQQFAARVTRRRAGRRNQVPSYIARFSQPTPLEPDWSVVGGRLRRLLDASGYESAEVTVRGEGNAAVLEGRVSSPRDARVIEDLLRLEPGVETVENRLRLKTAPPQ